MKDIFKGLLDYILYNIDWIFSGIGITFIAVSIKIAASITKYTESSFGVKKHIEIKIKDREGNVVVFKVDGSSGDVSREIEKAIKDIKGDIFINIEKATDHG